MVGNFVLRRRVNGAVKRNLQHKTHDLRWPTLISVAQRSAHCRHSTL